MSVGIIITLDSRIIPPTIARAAELRRNTFVHYLTRTLCGAPGYVFQMPLCWDAAAHQRGAAGPDGDDAWWLSVDHGALELSEHYGTYDRPLITCSDCIEWLRA